MLLWGQDPVLCGGTNRPPLISADVMSIQSRESGGFLLGRVPAQPPPAHVHSLCSRAAPPPWCLAVWCLRSVRSAGCRPGARPRGVAVPQHCVFCSAAAGSQRGRGLFLGKQRLLGTAALLGWVQDGLLPDLKGAPFPASLMLCAALGQRGVGAVLGAGFSPAQGEVPGSILFLTALLWCCLPCSIYRHNQLS